LYSGCNAKFNAGVVAAGKGMWNLGSEMSHAGLKTALGRFGEAGDHLQNALGDTPGKMVGNLLMIGVAEGALSKMKGGKSGPTSSGQLIKTQSESIVDLELHYKKEWTSEQRAAADAKCAALTDADTTVVKNPQREGQASTRYKKAGNEVPPGNHVDHVQDLQLNGADAVHNMSPLDASVNTSLGVQIQQRIKDLPAGTRIGRVSIKDRPKEAAAK